MTAAILIAVLALAGPASKNPESIRKLPPCARFCEWMDTQEQTGSFYDGLPETAESMDTAASAVSAAGLPFGYPDSVCGVIEGIPAPTSVTVAPSGLYLYVMGSPVEGITVLRVSSLEITGRIMVSDSSLVPGDPLPEAGSVCSGTFTIRTHPRGGYIYVVDSAQGTVSVYGTGEGTLVASVRVGEYPSDIAFNPAGDVAYVTCRDSDQIFVLE